MSKTVNKALDILEALSQARGEVSLAQLSQVLDMHPSTLHRLLRTLTGRRFVRRNSATRKYTLGFRLAEIAAAVPNETHLVESARPLLAALVKDVGETANLVVRYQDEAVYVDQVQCDAMVRGFTQIGARAPLHCTGVGKVLLAYCPPEEIDRYIEETGLPPRTSHTITNPYAFREHLEEIRAQGFAVDNEERELGTRCVAAPVRDNSGNVIAAISISGPATRLHKERWDSLALRVKDATSALSSSIGFVDKGSG